MLLERVSSALIEIVFSFTRLRSQNGHWDQRPWLHFEPPFGSASTKLLVVLANRESGIFRPAPWTEERSESCTRFGRLRVCHFAELI